MNSMYRPFQVRVNKMLEAIVSRLYEKHDVKYEIVEFLVYCELI